MKQLVFILLLNVCQCVCVKADTALNIGYLIREREYMEQSVPMENNYELTISGDSSWFRMEIDPTLDYLLLIPEPYDVLKNYKDSVLLYREGISTLKFCYSEPIPVFDWELMDQDSVVCGYSCQKAKTTYRGRTWNVWFSPDLPYDNGPWKLGGLPGLILKAIDSKGDFYFEAYRIKNCNKIKIPFNTQGYAKTTREMYLQELLSFYKDFEEFYESHGITMPQQLENGKVKKVPSRIPCLKEEVTNAE